MPWWSASYWGRVAIPLPSSPSGYAAGACVAASMETLALVYSRGIRADRKDLRVVYDDGTTATEIDRVLTDTATIRFRLPASVAPGVTPTGYWLYYGNPTEATEPKSDPRNVFASYVDGDDLAGLTTTGTVQATSIPRPGFIKAGSNPVLVPTPGTGDKDGIRDCDGLWYEHGYWWCFYDAEDFGAVDGIGGWTSYLARSRDLLTWEKLGNQLTLGGSFHRMLFDPDGQGAYWIRTDAASASASILHKFTVGGVTKYYLTYLGTPVVTDGTIPNTPYILHGAESDAITGPWTNKKVIVPTTGVLNDTSADGDCTADGQITTWDGGATYEVYYGNNDGGRSIGRATATHPLGPYTKTGTLLPGTEQTENPRIVHDPSRGVYYMLSNHVGSASPWGEHTVSNVLYWSTDRLTWTPANKTTITEPDAGAWDGLAIGLPSTPVIRDGVMYLAYDGADLAAFQAPNSYTHRYRKAGVIEARWPFAWGNAITVQAGGIFKAGVLSGDGTIRVRCRFTSTTGRNGVGVESGGSSVFLLNGTSTYGVARVEVNGGAASNTTYGRIHNHIKTVEFARSGASLTIRCSGQTVYQGTLAGVLDLRAVGSLVVESVTVDSGLSALASVPVPAVPVLSVSAPTVDGRTATIPFTRVPGSTVTVTRR